MVFKGFEGVVRWADEDGIAHDVCGLRRNRACVQAFQIGVDVDGLRNRGAVHAWEKIRNVRGQRCIRLC